MSNNVTLRFNGAVLRKARHAEVAKDQSLSQWVAYLVTRAASEAERKHGARTRCPRAQAKKIFRNLLDVSAAVEVAERQVAVTLDERAPNPSLMPRGWPTSRARCLGSATSGWSFAAPEFRIASRR